MQRAQALTDPSLKHLADALALAPDMPRAVTASVPKIVEDTTEVLTGVARDLYSYVPKLVCKGPGAGKQHGDATQRATRVHTAVRQELRQK